MRDELNKSLGVHKVLLDEHDDITIAKLYFLKYVADPNSYTVFLNTINKEDLTVTLGSQELNINEFLDRQIYKSNYLAKENITRRFNDPDRKDYLDNKSDPLFDSALQTIRDNQPDIAKKIETTITYINNLKINKILDEILEYNDLNYSGNRGDINAKIAIMQSLDSVSVEERDYDALSDLDLNLSSKLQGKSTIVQSKTQRPAQPERPSKPASSGARVSSPAVGTSGQTSSSPLADTQVGPALLAPFGGGSVDSGNGRFSGFGGVSGVSPSGPIPSADVAINNIFEAFGVHKYGDYNQRISGLIEELFSIQEISNMDVEYRKKYIINSLDLDAIKSDASFESITGILDSLLKITDGPIEVENAQVVKTDTIGASGANSTRTSPSPLADTQVGPALLAPFGGGSVAANSGGVRFGGAAFEATDPVTRSRAPVFGAKPASPSPEPESPSTYEIKGKIRGYVSELLEESGMGGKNFRGGLIKFLEEAERNIDQDPQLFERLNLFFQSVDKIGGAIVLASATQSKKINSEHVLEKGGEKVNLSVDCIESRLMREADSESFNYVIGARNKNLQTKVEGNFVLVDFDNKPDNESYAPYAVPDDDNFLRNDMQKNLYKLNLLDGISKMANAIIGGATDIRVTCVEGKGRSVTLALLFAKICKGDYSLNETRDKALIEELARDINSDYNYVTTGSHKCDNYQNSVKFEMLTEVLEEFQKRLKARDADSKSFENVKQVADSIKRGIVIERNIENQYRNQLSSVGIGVQP